MTQLAPYILRAKERLALRIGKGVDLIIKLKWFREERESASIEQLWDTRREVEETKNIDNLVRYYEIVNGVRQYDAECGCQGVDYRDTIRHAGRQLCQWHAYKEGWRKYETTIHRERWWA